MIEFVLGLSLASYVAFNLIFLAIIYGMLKLLKKLVAMLLKEMTENDDDLI